MSDRDAKLKIGVDASEMGPAAEKVGKLASEIKKLGDQGEGAAGDLNKTATALDRVESAEDGVSASSREAAGALEGVGASGQEAGLAAANGAVGAAQAIEAVTVAATEERAAIEAAGAEAVESGAQATAAMEKLTASEQEAAAEAKKLAAETAKAAAEAAEFSKGVQQIEAMGAALRQSGLNAEVQRQGLAALVTETDKLIRKQIEFGEEGKEGANLAGAALTKLKAHLADVNAELAEEVTRLRTVGDEGRAAFDEATSGVIVFEDAADAATKQIMNGWEQLNDTFRITPRQLGYIGQAVESAKLAIVEASERGQAATLEQLATLERLENEYAKLTMRANQLTNAVKDNAVRLKEGGAQITGLGMGIAQLGSVLGPTGAKVGFLIGNVSQLGSVMENLKDSAAALNLGTLKAGQSLATTASQAGIVAVVFAAAAAAGVKLASTNEQNAESTNRLWKEMKNLASGEIDRVSDQLGGLQRALQTLAISTSTKDLKQGFAELLIAAGRGEDGVKLFNAALRDGLPPMEALRLATTKSADVLKFYEDSLKGGAAGQALWARALAESGGNAERMIEFIREHNGQMQRSITITAEQTEAQKENNAAASAALQIARMKADTEEHVLTTTDRNTQALTDQARANQQLERAINGTTGAISSALASIRSMVTESDINSAALANMAGTLAEVAANTDGLTAEQRARIDTVIELAQRGTELTEAEQAYAVALATSIIAGDNKVVSLKSQTDASAALKEATDALVAATQAEATAQDDKSTAIEKAVAAAEKLLASNKPLEVNERLRLSTLVELGREIGDLASQQDRLNQATADGLAAQSEAGAVESELILVKSGKVDWLQREIDVRAEIIQSLAKEKAGTEDLAASSVKAQEIQKTAHGVYTNVIDDSQKAAGATKAAGDAAEKAGGQFGDVLVKRLADGRVVILNVSESIGEASDRLSALGERAEKAGPAVKRAFDDWAGGTSAVASVADKLKELEALFASLEDRSARITTNVNEMARAIEYAGNTASKASGNNQLVAPE